MHPESQNAAESEVLSDYYAHPPCVILHLTDRCNLECSFCVKGVPFQKEDELRDLALSDLDRIAELLRDYRYDILKISGGEPTLHSGFAEITRRLPDLFPGKKYYLATNGAGLQKFREVLPIYDRIDLSYYPEQTAQARYYSKARDLVSLHPNIVEMAKGLDHDDPANRSGWAADTRDGFAVVDDIRTFPNFGRTNVFQKCGLREWRVIVNGRIYPCCVASGLAEVRGISRSELSVPLDANWQQAIRQLEASMSAGACQQCWVDCEKWKLHPTIDLFDRNSLTGLPEIVRAPSLRLGKNWGVLEQFEGEVFRWVENNAQVIVQRSAQSVQLAVEVEPGPGLGGQELSLALEDSSGTQLDRCILRGRGTAMFLLRGGPEREEHLTLRCEGGGHTIASDPRILNFRAFQVDLHRDLAELSLA
jgi:hypothetical protein